MKYISRNELDQMFQGKNEIKAEDLVYVLEEKLGYAVSLEEKPVLSEKQKKLATRKIFSEPEVLEQLKYAKENKDPEFSAYSGDETEFAELVDKVNGRR